MFSTFDRHDTGDSAASVVAHVRDLIERGALRSRRPAAARARPRAADRRQPSDGPRRAAHARGDRRDPIAARIGHLHPRRTAHARLRPAQLPRRAPQGSRATMSTRRGGSSRSAPPASPPNAPRPIISRRSPRRSPASSRRSPSAQRVPRARHQFPSRRRRRVGQPDCGVARRDGLGALLRAPPRPRPSAPSIATCATRPRRIARSIRRSARATSTARGGR